MRQVRYAASHSPTVFFNLFHFYPDTDTDTNTETWNSGLIRDIVMLIFLQFVLHGLLLLWFSLPNFAFLLLLNLRIPDNSPTVCTLYTSKTDLKCIYTTHFCMVVFKQYLFNKETKTYLYYVHLCPSFQVFFIHCIVHIIQ